MSHIKMLRLVIFGLRFLRVVELTLLLLLTPSLLYGFWSRSSAELGFAATLFAVVCLTFHRLIYLRVRNKYFSIWIAATDKHARNERRLARSYHNYSGPPLFAGPIGLAVLYKILALAVVLSLVISVIVVE